MTSPWIPTDRQVEDAFSYDPEYEYHQPDDPGYVHRNRAAFKRWLTQRDAQVRAAARLEAADEIDTFVPRGPGSDHRKVAYEQAAAHLRRTTG